MPPQDFAGLPKPIARTLECVFVPDLQRLAKAGGEK